MQTWALTLREIKAFWYSPIAYVIGAVFTLLQGWTTWTLMVILAQSQSSPLNSIALDFFINPVSFFSTVVMIPMITMRSFSEEKRSGSFETLMTAPVSEFQVVLAKFFGAVAIFSLLWLSTSVYLIGLRFFVAFDWKPIVTGYCGMIAYGAVLISLGNFASSLTRNQIIAGFITLMIIILSFSLGWAELFTSDPNNLEFFEKININTHLVDFTKGLINTQTLVLFGTIIASALLLTMQVIENPKFRS